MSKLNENKRFAYILEWQQSGLSQKEWCLQHGIAYSSFHYWYRRFRSQLSETTPVNKNGFVRLQVEDPVSVMPWCELVLSSGHKLLFYQPVSESFISNLLR